MKNLLLFISMVAIIAASSCSSDTGGGPTFDRALLVEGAADNLILPAYEAALLAFGNLNTAAGNFAATPNGQTLQTLQQSWTSAKLAWKRAEPYNFGPIETKALETSVDLWPTNDFGIETTLASTPDFNIGDLQAVASDRKGLPAIEYLIFAGAETDIITRFANDANRGNYLTAITSDLFNIMVAIINEWSPSGNNYRQTFVSSTGTSASASTTVLANEMIFYQEFIKNFQIATPLGLRTNGIIQPDLVEAPYSGQSLNFALASLNAVEDAFTGNGSSGFDAYLDALNIQSNDQPLSQAITSKINSARAALNAITPPLREAVTNNPQAVEAAFIELQDLTVLLKVDMMSNLGLTVTFSDNDGD